MTKTTALFLLVFHISACTHSKSEPTGISSSIVQFVHLIKEKNISEINKNYINRKMGIFEIKRIGATNSLANHTNIEKAYSSVGSIYQILFSFPSEKNISLPMQEKITFRCGAGGWGKQGIFYEQTMKFPSISNQRFNDILSELATHNNLVKVTVTEIDLVLYFAKIKQQYYLIAIDRTEADCSA